jgi:hypothetical protein
MDLDILEAPLTLMSNRQIMTHVRIMVLMHLLPIPGNPIITMDKLMISEDWIFILRERENRTMPPYFASLVI